MPHRSSPAPEPFLELRLQELRRLEALRSLPAPWKPGDVDFCSNDYLGVATDELLSRESCTPHPSQPHGSTGSRLISGNSEFIESVESRLATFFGTDAALIFNSGYDANLGLLGAVPRENDDILYDERVHASVMDGIRLSSARSYPLRHNDVAHLAHRLDATASDGKRGERFVVMESIYSMDGDRAPLEQVVDLCSAAGAHLIVDEAHATGVFGSDGRGLVAAHGLVDAVFARVHTFGKALGAHGAVIVGSQALRETLINFARSFIYTTALPGNAIATVDHVVSILGKLDERRELLQQRIAHFIEHRETSGRTFLPVDGPIQGLVIPGNPAVLAAAGKLVGRGFQVRAIRSPTVRRGQERIRICLHAHNTSDEIDRFFDTLAELP